MATQAMIVICEVSRAAGDVFHLHLPSPSPSRLSGARAHECSGGPSAPNNPAGTFGCKASSAAHHSAATEAA